MQNVQLKFDPLLHCSFFKIYLKLMGKSINEWAPLSSRMKSVERFCFSSPPPPWSKECALFQNVTSNSEFIVSLSPVFSQLHFGSLSCINAVFFWCSTQNSYCPSQFLNPISSEGSCGAVSFITFFTRPFERDVFPSRLKFISSCYDGFIRRRSALSFALLSKPSLPSSFSGLLVFIIHTYIYMHIYMGDLTRSNREAWNHI